MLHSCCQRPLLRLCPGQLHNCRVGDHCTRLQRIVTSNVNVSHVAWHRPAAAFCCSNRQIAWLAAVHAPSVKQLAYTPTLTKSVMRVRPSVAAHGPDATPQPFFTQWVVHAALAGTCGPFLRQLCWHKRGTPIGCYYTHSFDLFGLGLYDLLQFDPEPFAHDCQ